MANLRIAANQSSQELPVIPESEPNDGPTVLRVGLVVGVLSIDIAKHFRVDRSKVIAASIEREASVPEREQDTRYLSRSTPGSP